MRLYPGITLLLKIICIICVVFSSVSVSWAQQSDSIRITLKNRTKKVVRLPEIKANIQPYKPSYMSLGGSSSLFNTYSESKPSSSISIINKDKLLTIVKIFPNPVENQINISLSINKDTPISYKIIDLLGNEVLTLANEHLTAGEQTRTFNIPNRLNPGIYFLRVIAGSESQIKRISVL